MNTLNHYQMLLSKNSIHITPIIISFFLILGTLLVRRIIQKGITKFCEQQNVEPTITKAILHVTNICVYALGVILILENLNIQISLVLRTLGVIAIGISIALQNTLTSMTSGMLILFYEPFCIGDYIICPQQSNIPNIEGKIIDINLRLTTLEYNGNIVLIPNNILYNTVVVVKKK